MLNGLFIFTPSLFITLAEVLSYFLIFIGFPYFLFCFVKQWLAITERSLRIMALAVFMCYLVCCWVFNPGFVGIDDLFSLSELTKGNAWGWSSLTYSFFLTTGVMVWGSLGFPIVVNIFLFNYLSFKTFTILSQTKLNQSFKVGLGLFLTVLLLHPINQGFLLFHSRDVLFSLLLISLGFMFFKKTTITSVFAITFLALIIGDLRQEAKIYLILVPVSLLVIQKWKWLHFKIYTSIALVLGFFYYVSLPKYLDVSSYSYMYQTTAYILPLSQIFHDNAVDSFSEEQLRNIDAVVSVEALVKYFNPTDIDTFHHGGVRTDIDFEKMKKFKSTSHELFWKFKESVLSNRIYLAKSMLNLGAPWVGFVSDALREGKKDELPELFAKLPESWISDPLSDGAKIYLEGLQASVNNASLFVKILGSYLLPMIFYLSFY